MIDHITTVTEDELHAYVDGELPVDRRSAVEVWLTTHPEDAAKVAAWRAQADAIRTRYGAVAAEPVPDRLTLHRIARSGGRSWMGMAAAAAIAAFLIGGAVGWMARGASAAAPSSFQLFTSDAIEAHKLYVVEVRHPVEVPGAERVHLVQWLSKRLGTKLQPPDFERINLKLVGGRLLPGPAGDPAAFFMYEGPSGERFTFYCARSAAPETAMRYREEKGVAAIYWGDHNVSYVMSGPADRERLLSLAKRAYDQIDTHAGTPG